MALSGRVLTVECPCAGTPHEVDTVTFRAVLPFAGGVAAVRAMGTVEGDGEGKVLALDLGVALFPVYLTHAVEAWTFLDTDGAPLPVTAAADGVLPFGIKFAIADAADDLFGGEVTAPFRGRMPASSPAGPTAPSTLPKPTSGAKRRLRSEPSLPSASAATEPSTP